MAARMIPIDNPRRPEDATPHSVRVFVEELMTFISKQKLKLPGFKPVFLYTQTSARLFNEDIGRAVIKAVNVLEVDIDELYTPLKVVLISEEAIRQFMQTLKGKMFPEEGSLFNVLCFLAVSVRIGISVALQGSVAKAHGIFITEIAKVLTEDLKPKMAAAGGWYRVMDLLLNISEDRVLMKDAMSFNLGDPSDYC